MPCWETLQLFFFLFQTHNNFSNYQHYLMILCRVLLNLWVMEFCSRFFLPLNFFSKSEWDEWDLLFSLSPDTFRWILSPTVFRQGRRVNIYCNYNQGNAATQNRLWGKQNQKSRDLRNHNFLRVKTWQQAFCALRTLFLKPNNAMPMETCLCFRLQWNP